MSVQQQPPWVRSARKKKLVHPSRLVWETGVDGGIVFANSDDDRRIWYGPGNTEAGPFAANVPATIMVGGVRYLRSHRSRTNLNARSEELNDGVWSLLNSATITANTHNRPNGDAGADRINHSANGLSAAEQTPSGTWGDNRAAVGSVFHRSETGSENWRLQMGSKAGAGSAINQTATTSWQRAQTQINMSTGGATPYQRLRNASDALARNVVHATAQFEGGQTTDVYYAGPPLLTGSTAKTAPDDVAYTDTPPAFLMHGAAQVKVFGGWISSEIPTNERRYIWFRDSVNYLAILNDVGTVRARLRSTAGTIQRDITMTSRSQIVTLTADIAGGSLTVSGASSGDGTTTGTTSRWPMGRLYVGVGIIATLPTQWFDGAIGEPVAV